jgi:hypothetical protein
MLSRFLVIPALSGLALMAQEPFPMEARSSFQTIALPFPGERMGLYGLEVMHEGASGFAGGIGGYGAITGKRGGFITLGLAGAWRPQITDRVSLDLGLFSGGGGAGRAAVGGGWMLEGHGGVDLRLDAFRLGLAYQRIRFPNGDIDSRQWRFSIGLPFSMPQAQKGASLPALPWREISLETTVLNVAPPRAEVLLDDSPSDRSVGLVGFTVKAGWRGPWFLSLELAAAHSGQADGYMEGLLGAGLRGTLAEGWRAHLRVAGGPVGGGHLDVGGGMAWKVAAGLEADLGHRIFLGAEVGEILTPGANFKARTTQVSLGRRFRMADPEGTPPQPSWTLEEMPFRLRAGLAELTRPRRSDPAHQPVRTQTLALDLPMTTHLYVTGQGAFSTSGGAGGWATGLVGLGAEDRFFNGKTRAYLEALIGAGGGGGLDSRGGAILQPMLGVAQSLGAQAEAHLRVGRLKSLRNGIDSPIVELGLGWRFGLASVGP